MRTSASPGEAVKIISYWKYFLLTVIIALVFLLRLHSLNEPFQGDLTTYGYIAHNMLDGKPLYTYLWDHKPPGIYWAYMMAELLWGYSQHAIVYLGVAFSALSILFLYLFLHRIAGTPAALLGSAFFALASNSVVLEANEPNAELFLNTLTIMAVWAFALWSEKGKGPYLFLSGTFFALATLFKTVAVFPVFFLCVYLLVPFSTTDLSRWIKDRTVMFAWFLSPAALFWLAIFGYFGAKGRFTHFWEAVFAYNVHYVNYKGNILEHLWNFFSTPQLFFHTSLKEIWILVVLSILWFSWSREKYSSLRRSFFVFLFLGLSFSVASPGRYYAHYYQLLLPIFCVLPALFFQDAFARTKKSRRKYDKSILTALLLFTVIFLGHYQLQYLRMTPFEVSEKKYGKRYTEAYNVAKFVEKITKPCEHIYEWGGETGIYYYSKRESVTGIIYIYPLFTGPKEDTINRTKRVFSDVVDSMPAVFIYNRAFGRLEQNLFFDLLQERYKLTNQISSYLIFEAKQRKPCQTEEPPGPT